MRFKLLATAALFSIGLVAHADTTFYLSGTLTSGATFEGTLNWAPTGGVLGSATFTEADIVTSAGYSYSGPIYTVPDSGEKATSERFPEVILITDSSVLQDDVLSRDFTGSFLCGTAALCGDEIGSQYLPGGPNYTAVSSISGESVADGTISLQRGGSPPASITPEPSSFALLGTGLLGVAGFVKRRFN